MRSTRPASSHGNSHVRHIDRGCCRPAGHSCKPPRKRGPRSRAPIDGQGDDDLRFDFPEAPWDELGVRLPRDHRSLRAALAVLRSDETGAERVIDFVLFVLGAALVVSVSMLVAAILRFYSPKSRTVD